MSTQYQHHSQEFPMANYASIQRPSYRIQSPYDRQGYERRSEPLDPGYVSDSSSQSATHERYFVSPPARHAGPSFSSDGHNNAIPRSTYTASQHVQSQPKMASSYYQHTPSRTRASSVIPQALDMHSQQWPASHSTAPNNYGRLSYDQDLDSKVIDPQLLHDSPQQRHAEYHAPSVRHWDSSELIEPPNNIHMYHQQDQVCSKADCGSCYDHSYTALDDGHQLYYDQNVNVNVMSADANNKMYLRHPSPARSHYPLSRPQYHESSIVARRNAQHIATTHDESAEEDDTAEKKLLKPQKSKHQPWVRTNHKTLGGNRTMKINTYRPAEKYHHQDYIPIKNDDIGGWQSSRGFVYEYNAFGELDQPTLSVEQIRDFLYEHPYHGQNRSMKLWIQKVAADSARRYPTRDSDHCRFADCPTQRKGKGTMLHGHYRVAFDEYWNTYGEVADPFLVAGFVHLDCLERFLDFPDICRRLDVEVDGRVDLKNEPKGKNRAAFDQTDKATYAEAVEFVETVRRGGTISEYPGPISVKHLNHWDWDHELDRNCYTLTYKMSKAKLNQDRPQAQITQFQKRLTSDRQDRVAAGLSPNSFADYSNTIMHNGSVWLLQEANAVRKVEEHHASLSRIRQERRDADNSAKGKRVRTRNSGRGTNRAPRRIKFDEEEDEEDEVEVEADEEEITAENSTRELRSAGLTRSGKTYVVPDEDDIDDVVNTDPVPTIRKRRFATDDDENSDEEWNPQEENGQSPKRRRFRRSP